MVLTLTASANYESKQVIVIEKGISMEHEDPVSPTHKSYGNFGEMLSEIGMAQPFKAAYLFVCQDERV
jgi:hypothetical protein